MSTIEACSSSMASWIPTTILQNITHPSSFYGSPKYWWLIQFEFEFGILKPKILKSNFVKQLFIGPELIIETNPKPYLLFNPPKPNFHVCGKK